MSQKIYEMLRSLKDEKQNLKNLAIDLFSELDPERKHYRELVWLSAIPETLYPEAEKIFSAVASVLTPKKITFKQLMDSDVSGIMFYITETGDHYDYLGVDPADGRGLVKRFGTKYISTLHDDTEITRLF